MMVGVYSECYGVQVIPEGKWFCQKCRLSPHDPIVRPSLSLSAFCLSHRSHQVQRAIQTLTNRCCVRCIFPDLRLVSSFHRSLQTDDERRRVGSRPLREFRPWDIVRRLLQTGTCAGSEEVCQGEREDGQSQSSFCSSLLETNLTVLPVASDFRRSPFPQRCSICHEKGGAPIQCASKKCCKPFHVSCARDKGLLESMAQEGPTLLPDFERGAMPRAWCETHRPVSDVSVLKVFALNSCGKRA